MAQLTAQPVSEYRQSALDFLAHAGIAFTATLIGSDCPRFCEDATKDMDKVDSYPRKTHIHGKHYRCTFTRKPTEGDTPKGKVDFGNGHLTIDFWNSYADEEYNALGSQKYHRGESVLKGRKKLPTPYDVLACIQKNEVGTFENFCGDFGYDTDSRRAEETYKAVCNEYRKIRQFFTAEEMERLQEIN